VVVAELDDSGQRLAQDVGHRNGVVGATTDAATAGASARARSGAATGARAGAAAGARAVLRSCQGRMVAVWGRLGMVRKAGREGTAAVALKLSSLHSFRLGHRRAPPQPASQPLLPTNRIPCLHNRRAKVVSAGYRPAVRGLTRRDQVLVQPLHEADVGGSLCGHGEARFGCVCE
jgi:hypothetical protein